MDDDRPDVLLTGLLFYDLVLTGLGKPPTPGEEIWTAGMGCGPGGIANLAVAAARFGLKTSLATVFGDDFYGAYCHELLAGQEGVDLSLSRAADGWPTPVTVSLAYGHDRALVTHGQEPPFSQDVLMDDPPEARTALVHIEAEPRQWLAKAAANGTHIYADVGWDPTQQWSADLLDQLSLCHAFLPNETEAMAYTRTDSASAALGTLAELVPVAVVTRGGDGAVAVDQTTGEYAEVPALDIDVLDATGAGDVFGASFVAASLGGWPLGVPGARAGLRDHHLDPERGQPGPGLRRRRALPLHPRLVRPEAAARARPVLRRPDHDGRLRARRAEDRGRLQQPVRRGARTAPQGRDQERRRPRQGPEEGLE
ncbi:PfkB family carbohydrate kinase [Streptomyces sp. NPDC005202]|uniref:PfkB family carbohydrate kinase n=1 Tax=Streptomyces sp. NPDC005202 TaxID=3157021 RepID=UPI0033B8173E